MAKTRLEGAGELYQHYPRTVVILTVHARGKDNAMAVAWHSPVCSKPPLYGVCVSVKRFTCQLVLESREFGVNFLPLEKAQLIAWVGGISGNEADKFEKFKIIKEKSVKTSIPILRDAYVAYKCELVDNSLYYGNYEWFVGQIVATYYDKKVFTRQQTLDLNKVRPALYLGADFYATAAKESVKYISRG